MIRFPWLRFDRASGGARNGARWGTTWRRIYCRGRWTPLVVCHFRRLRMPPCIFEFTRRTVVRCPHDTVLIRTSTFRQLVRLP